MLVTIFSVLKKSFKIAQVSFELTLIQASLFKIWDKISNFELYTPELRIKVFNFNDISRDWKITSIYSNILFNMYTRFK